MGTLFEECERPPVFQVTAPEINSLISVFVKVATTRDAINISQVAWLNNSLSCWDYSRVTPLSSLAQDLALVSARFAEQTSSSTRIMTVTAPGVPSDTGYSGEYGGRAGFGGATGSGGASSWACGAS